MKSSRHRTIIALSVAGALALGGASIASANPGFGPGNGLKNVLDGLVTKGTITTDQENAILNAIQANAPKPKTSGAPSINGAPGVGRGMDDHGRRGGFVMNSAARQAVITSTLGITADQLKAARQAGKSLAAIDPSKTQALITALVNFDSTQIDAAVTAGKITAAQATTLKSKLTTRVTNEVNATPHAGAHPMTSPQN
jgi:hypothetical protein